MSLIVNSKVLVNIGADEPVIVLPGLNQGHG